MDINQIESWANRYFYLMNDTLDFVYPINVFSILKLYNLHKSSRKFQQIQENTQYFGCKETHFIISGEL